MNSELYNKIERCFKGGNNMAVLTKDNLVSIKVKQTDAKKFIDEINKNKISNEFLKKCKQSAALFKGNIEK